METIINKDNTTMWLEDLQPQIDVMILATPTGELRNALCDLNIQIMATLEVFKR